jgi:uncharacterized protein YifN (PemK superfamily)
MHRALSSRSVRAVIVNGKSGSTVYLAVGLTTTQAMDAIRRGFKQGSIVIITKDKEYVATG